MTPSPTSAAARRSLADLPARGRGSRGPGDWSARWRATAAPTTRPPRLRFANEVFTSSAPARRAPPTTVSAYAARRPVGERRPAGRGAARPAASRQADATADCPTAWPASGCPRRTSSTAGAGDYGNHDLANRPNDLDDRLHRHPRHRGRPTRPRSTWCRTRPTCRWHYTLRSSDGHIAQHVDGQGRRLARRQLVRQLHSIGIEHEGFAAERRDLVHRGDVPHLGRAGALPRRQVRHPARPAHIIGHDQVPGTIAGDRRAACTGTRARTGTGSTTSTCSARRSTADASAGRPVDRDRQARLRRQRPAGDRLRRPPATPCAAAGHELRLPATSQPDADSPLVTDIGLHPTEPHQSRRASPTSAPAPLPASSSPWRRSRATGSRSGTSASRRGSTTRPATRMRCPRAGRS